MADQAASGAKPKAYTVGRLEGGGAPPEIGKLVSDTVAEFGDNLGPYLLAGLGLYLVSVPAALVAVFLGYLLGGIGFVGVSVVGTIAGAAIGDNVDQGLGGLVLVVSQLGAMALAFALLVGIVMLVVGLLAPMHASLLRAIAVHQRGEGTLELSASFATLRQDLVSVIAVNMAVIGLSFLGLLLCYVPALAVMVVFPFAVCLVALKGLGAKEALARSFRHSTANLSWYLVFAVVMFVGGMVAAYIPVVGPVFVAALQVRACRQMFGDA